jgi:hypothetical protein
MIIVELSPSVAGPSARDPWLCEPASRRGCRYLEAAMMLAYNEPAAITC